MHWLRERVAELHGIGLTPTRLKGGALAALTLLYLASGLFSVQPGEVGVRLRFGEIVAPDLPPGLHVRLPWPLESHEIIPSDLVRRAELGFRSDAAANLAEKALARDRLTVGGPSNPVPNTIQATGFWFQKEAVPEELFLLTGDGNLVDLRFTLQYRVTDPIAFAYGLAQPDELVRSLMLAAMRGVVARGGIDQLYTDQRGAVEDQVLATVQPTITAPASRCSPCVSFTCIRQRRCMARFATWQALRRTSCARLIAPRPLRSRQSIGPRVRPRR